MFRPSPIKNSAPFLAFALAALLPLPAAAHPHDGPDAPEPPVAATAPIVVDFGGDTAYLGVRLEEETDLPEGGARVTHVVVDAPAAIAGVKEGDVIIKFDGSVIRGPNALGLRLTEREPGDSVAIVVLRDGDRVKLDAELKSRGEFQENFFVLPDGGNGAGSNFYFNSDEWREQQAKLREELKELGDRVGKEYAEPEYWEQLEGQLFSAPRAFGLWSRPKLGVQLLDPTPELREHLGGDSETGVIVSKVLPGTPAERAGVAVGDLIVSVAGSPIGTSDDLVESLTNKAGETFTVEVVRDGERVDLEVTIPDPDSDPPTGPRA